MYLLASSGGSDPMPGMPGMPGMTTGPSSTMHMGGPMWMPLARPTPGRLLAWHPQPFPLELIVCVLLLALYGWGVARLVRRGDRWPVGRTVAFAVGVATVAEVTCTGIGGYGMELFSVHMVQHMVLSMLSPVFLLLGAPVTLALRALPAGGRRSPRALLVAVLHSRVAAVASSPLFTLPVFIASLYGLYFTGIFAWLMRSWLGHEVMLAHFLAVGLLFFWPIIGVDPSPRRRSHLIRMLELFIGMPFHAFFGITVMMSSGLLSSYYAHPPASWGVDVIGDQHTGGALAWGFSEIPTLVVLIALLFQWLASDRRDAARRDRRADRDDDAELTAYNAYLAGLATGRARPAAEPPAAS